MKENWDDLRFFLAVARQELPMKAAVELGVSYVTVLRRISALEDRLQTKLFNRHPTGYTLTAEGRALRQSSERMEDTVRTFSASLKTSGDETSGPLPVSCGDGIGLTVLMRYLPSFRRGNPEVEVELRVDQLIPAISRREPRICFRPMMTTTPSGPNIVRDRVSEFGFGIYASTEYIERRGRPKSISELREHDLIGGDESIRYLETATWFGDNIGPRNLAVKTNSMRGMWVAAGEGMGIALLPHLLAGGDPRLTRLVPEFNPGKTELWILTPTNLAQNPTVRRFIDHFVNSAAADESWFMGG